jgi:endonuclease YncB( thermonuclease family)
MGVVGERLMRNDVTGNSGVNAEMVRQGHAQVSTFPPHVRHQELCPTLQRNARAA